MTDDESSASAESPTESAESPSESLVLKRPSNQILAIGECALLATFTREYGQMPVHRLMDRLIAVAEHNNIHMLYETSDNVADIAVGFMLVGWLSPTVGRLYVARNRELTAAECNSGSDMWILENCCPFGHFKAMRSLMEKEYPTVPAFNGLINMKVTSIRNTRYERNI